MHLLQCKLDVEVEEPASRARDRRTAELRRVVATVGVEPWEQKGRRLAEVLNKNPDVVSWWVGEGVRRRLDDPSFADWLDELDERMVQETARPKMS
jgi:hypothetical protein